MDEWLRNHLVCPRDKKSLETNDQHLICPDGHKYPIYSGIPVLLVEESESTHDYIKRTLETVAKHPLTNDYVDHININDNEIDKYVQGEIPYTSGNLYFSVQYKLSRYPIPKIRLPDSDGKRLLDIGCNWGRWSIAAAQKGYRPIGLDPSLEAILAARRVSAQLGADAKFVVGDARFLPFADGSFDTVFSYGVFQHLSKEHVRICLDEAARVLKPEGNTLFQMPNKYGIRQYQQYLRRGRTEGKDFEIRYWTPSELMSTFEARFGEMKMTADCYFGLGIQASDVDLLPLKYRIVVYSSEFLRKLSTAIKPLSKLADSVYLESVKQN